MKNKLKQKMIFPSLMQVARLGGGAQPVCNFPSIVSKFIITEMFNIWMSLYNEFYRDMYIIIDGSTGWGGRLGGALGCYADLRTRYKKMTGRELSVVYITTDPHKEISSRFELIIEDWFTQIDPESDRNSFKFHKAIFGSETTEFQNYCRNILDMYGVTGGQLSLTSPPYFNREIYGGIGSDGQSHTNYEEYDLWRDGFLKGSIKNIYTLLQPNGRFYLNIANLKDGKLIHPLESDSVKFANEYGFKCIHTYKMLLSGSGKGSINQVFVNGKIKKYEPIFILVK